MFKGWEIKRDKIRQAMRKLACGGMLQVTFSSIVSVTRFKIPKGRELGEIECPKCGIEDSRQHCKRCYEIEAPKKQKEKEWLNGVDQIMNKICSFNPAKNKELEAKKNKPMKTEEEGTIQI